MSPFDFTQPADCGHKWDSDWNAYICPFPIRCPHCKLTRCWRCPPCHNADGSLTNDGRMIEVQDNNEPEGEK